MEGAGGHLSIQVLIEYANANEWGVRFSSFFFTLILALLCKVGTLYIHVYIRTRGNGLEYSFPIVNGFSVCAKGVEMAYGRCPPRLPPTAAAAAPPPPVNCLHAFSLTYNSVIWRSTLSNVIVFLN